MLRLCELPWGLLTVLTGVLQVSAVPSVNVGLKAAFPAGPYLLELIETAASENASSYFPLLDRVASGHFSSAATDQELYSSFLDVLRQDGHITTPDAISTFNLALSLRSAAPRIEAHYQHYSTAIEPVVGNDGDCLNWILYDGNQYCDPQMKEPAKESLFATETSALPFERVIGAGKDAVLYADPSSEQFGALHQALTQAAAKGEVQYRLRYRKGQQITGNSLLVSGYGVELALKRTDYIVIDDREGHESKDQKDANVIHSPPGDLETPEDTSIDLDNVKEAAELKPISATGLKGLSKNAAGFILESETPFDTLIKFTQDIPKYAAELEDYAINQFFTKEHDENRQLSAPAGANFLWINGVQLTERQIEPFALVDMIRRERTLLQGVRNLGFSGKQAVSLLGHEKVATAKTKKEPQRLDWTDRQEEGKVIIWLNDLEKDKQYSDYPRTVDSLLQRTFPGQIPPIAKNMFTLIVPVDLSDAEDLTVLSQVFSLIRRGIPVHFGFVPLITTDDAIKQAKIAYHLAENYGVAALTEYFKEISQETDTATHEEAFTSVIGSNELQADATAKTLDQVLESDSYAKQTELSKSWSHRLKASTGDRMVFLDGIAVPRERSWMQTVSMKLTEDLQVIQMRVFKGLIDDDAWIPGIFLENAASKRNAYISPEDDNSIRFVDISKVYSDHLDLFDTVPTLQNGYWSGKEDWAVLTVILDLASSHGRSLLLEALKFKKNHNGVRLDIIDNPAAGESNPVADLLASSKKLGGTQKLEDLEAILTKQKSPEASEAYQLALDRFLSATKLTRGTQSLILNGRIVGPISPEDTFEEDDFKELFTFEKTNRITPVYQALDDLGLGKKLADPISAAKVTSLTALSTSSDLPEGIFESAPSLRSSIWDQWASTHTAFEVGNPDTASVHIVGLLNPLSEQGQRWAPILKVLSELDGVYVKLFMNPKEEISELPVKRFFRYVLESKPSFDESGKLRSLNATFKGLPSETLLTAGMNVPPAWLVSAEASVHDLDNIKLSTVKNDVEALYELEHILIEGHSREGKGSPPKGAQLVLTTASEPLLDDTIIMANLGYFQFKANPGFYNIKLKEGRSAEIYNIKSIGAHGWEPVPGDEGTEVALIDFKGTTLYPRLERNPGMEKADVLEVPESSDDGLVSKGLKFAESLFGGSKKNEVAEQAHADINIFSVASGHLYERMLNIMMVSVMRNTKHTVKFWFIEQFLSPSFKEFIPHMAEEYGFKYEMVTFKWPHWLRQQKEKQREIWGYKILFLDVLFPLSLDKVIFVDADQIVRTDMIDLVNHDLEGAPYGFTPMCDSRTEMEGFRFWKQGYWANYLRGRPYHISALYVVDLRRFRQLAAGDRLRQQYHTLSADPNSLSNLDQDLPNNMQFQIPIHSLPQEWLWCETWCSDESQAEARTIDLCNNPETKEPKLDRARRQVPEWTVYDDEIAALDRRRKGESEKAEEKSAAEDVNTKSRRFEEEPVHTIDEL